MDRLASLSSAVLSLVEPAAPAETRMRLTCLCILSIACAGALDAFFVVSVPGLALLVRGEPRRSFYEAPPKCIRVASG